MEGIANTIGRFVAVEDDFMHSYDKRMEMILVELDITDGLPVEIEILFLDRLFTQRLDYLRIPFHCSRCRDVGHLRRECLVLLHGAVSPSTRLSPFAR